MSKNAESSLGIYSTIDTGAKEEDLYIETPINTNEKSVGKAREEQTLPFVWG